MNFLDEKIIQFLSRSSIEVAPDLIGCTIVRKFPNNRFIEAIIVETEAYTENDPACHAYKRKTRRNSVMFGEAGYIYVYKIYGIHHCLNIVTDLENKPSAVLIRAVELKEVDFLEENNKKNIIKLGAGPGKLCKTLKIDTGLNGSKLQKNGEINLLFRNKIFQEKIDRSELSLFQTTRIGITQGMELPWRWYLNESRSVSRR